MTLAWNAASTLGESGTLQRIELTRCHLFAKTLLIAGSY
jgi:hypothetical protein